MGDNELTVVVEDVWASYDHETRLTHVDIELSYEKMHTTAVGKRQVNYGAPRFRFTVDGDGVGRLAHIESRSHDRVSADPDGVVVADFRALPAAIEIAEGIGDVERVESIETTIEDHLADAENLTFEPE